jgi:hypothetical protein
MVWSIPAPFTVMLFDHGEVEGARQMVGARRELDGGVRRGAPEKAAAMAD